MIQLFEEEPPRNCSICVNALFGSGGVYCRLFHEDILNEAKTAAECEAYELEPGYVVKRS